MKLLFIHSDYIEYEAKEKAGNYAEEIKEKEKKERMEEALVAFIAVEKDDEKIVSKAINEIDDVAGKVNAKKIMLYPYAHLSSNLASPSIAKEVLNQLESKMKNEFIIKRAPFGWYKSFKISCKGHPLSELSRSVSLEEGEKEKEIEKEVKSSWHILTPDDGLYPAEEFDFDNYEELKKFYEYEVMGSRKAKKVPAHIKMMQDLELVDYEPVSDSGNMRWYPKGQLIKNLLEMKVDQICTHAGAMKVETPLMYDVEHPALKKYVEKFPARQYLIKSEDKEFFLRFAACFGQYLMAKDMTISYKHLPIRLFEIARSFRREKHGELSGIKRLRSFTMPDMHSLCADEQRALEEFKSQFLLSMEWIKALNLDCEVGMRFTKEFFDEHRDFARDIAMTVGKPILIEIWDEQYFYFVAKFEFNLNDSVDKTFALSTVQIDVENTRAFDITYTDENGNKRYPLLLHTSISGGIDRCLCALLENQAKEIERGKKGCLPFWLSPTQIRLIPVRDDFLDDCVDIASRLKGRIDIDDRDEGVSRKIRDAEKEWIPIIIVYGKKEKESDSFTPRFRFPVDKERFNLEELNKLIEKEMDGYPFAPLSLPKMLSKRPKFRG